MNAFRDRHVVMTGGGGFIGSRVLDRLVTGGADVVLLGRDMGKSPETAAHIDAGRVRFIRTSFGGDERQAMREAFSGDDLLILLGYVLPSATSPSARLVEEFALNVEPNIRLIEAAGDSAAHIAFASSVAIYGVPVDLPVAESARVAPLTPYAVAKMAVEHALRASATYRSIPTAILRYATVYGPGETVPRAIPNFIRASLGGSPLRIDGTGEDRSDYVHVDDVVEATIRALALRADGAFNIGTGIGTTTLDVAKAVLEATHADVRLTHGPARRAGPPVGFRCDTALAYAELGFRARHELAAGIAEEVHWFRSRMSPVGELAAANGAAT